MNEYDTRGVEGWSKYAWIDAATIVKKTRKRGGNEETEETDERKKNKTNDQFQLSLSQSILDKPRNWIEQRCASNHGGRRLLSSV